MMVESESPPPIPPKPRITLQIPPYNAPRVPSTASTGYWGPPVYPPHFQGAPPQTAGAGQPGGYYNPFMSMYQSKASDFMFRQFSDFKDFTMNTAKGGLSMGEKSAFWLYGKISTLSKRWFTHIFLFFCVALYGVAGAALFTALEGPFEKREVIDIRKERYDLAMRVWRLVNTSVTHDEQLWAGSLIKELRQFEVKVIESNSKGISDKYYEFKNDICVKKEYLNYSGKTKSDKKWTFWNAMFYSGTIYTTIDKNTQKGTSRVTTLITGGTELYFFKKFSNSMAILNKMAFYSFIYFIVLYFINSFVYFIVFIFEVLIREFCCPEVGGEMKINLDTNFIPI